MSAQVATTLVKTIQTAIPAITDILTALKGEKAVKAVKQVAEVAAGSKTENLLDNNAARSVFEATLGKGWLTNKLSGLLTLASTRLPELGLATESLNRANLLIDEIGSLESVFRRDGRFSRKDNNSLKDKLQELNSLLNPPESETKAETKPTTPLTRRDINETINLLINNKLDDSKRKAAIKLLKEQTVISQDAVKSIVTTWGGRGGSIPELGIHSSEPVVRPSIRTEVTEDLSVSTTDKTTNEEIPNHTDSDLAIVEVSKQVKDTIFNAAKNIGTSDDVINNSFTTEGFIEGMFGLLKEPEKFLQTAGKVASLKRVGKDEMFGFLGEMSNVFGLKEPTSEQKLLQHRYYSEKCNSTAPTSTPKPTAPEPQPPTKSSVSDPIRQCLELIADISDNPSILDKAHVAFAPIHKFADTHLNRSKDEFLAEISKGGFLGKVLNVTTGGNAAKVEELKDGLFAMYQNLTGQSEQISQPEQASQTHTPQTQVEQKTFTAEEVQAQIKAARQEGVESVKTSANTTGEITKDSSTRHDVKVLEKSVLEMLTKELSRPDTIYGVLYDMARKDGMPESSDKAGIQKYLHEQLLGGENAHEFTKSITQYLGYLKGEKKEKPDVEHLNYMQKKAYQGVTWALWIAKYIPPSVQNFLGKMKLFTPVANGLLGRIPVIGHFLVWGLSMFNEYGVGTLMMHSENVQNMAMAAKKYYGTGAEAKSSEKPNTAPEAKKEEPPKVTPVPETAAA